MTCEEASRIVVVAGDSISRAFWTVWKLGRVAGCPGQEAQREARNCAGVNVTVLPRRTRFP